MLENKPSHNAPFPAVLKDFLVFPGQTRNSGMTEYKPGNSPVNLGNVGILVLICGKSGGVIEGIF